MAGQWEYRILEIDLENPRAPEALNNAGREGWEAIAASVRRKDDQSDHLVVLLKRPKRRAQTEPRTRAN